MISQPTDYNQYFARNNDFGEIQQAYQQGQMERAAQKKAMQEEMDRKSFMEFAQSENPTQEQFMNIVSKMRSPEVIKQTEKAFAMMDKAKREKSIADASKIYYLAMTNPESVPDKLMEMAKSDPEHEADITKMAEAFKANKNLTTAGLYGFLASSASGRKVLEATQKQMDEKRKQEKLPHEVNAMRPTSIRETEEFARMTPEQQAMHLELQKNQRPTTTVNVDQGDKTLYKEAPAIILKAKDDANAAVDRLIGVQNARANLDKAIVGTGANARLGLERLGSFIGATGKDSKERLQSTTALIQQNAQFALDARKFLAGQGQITENEQKLLMKAQAGDISFTKEEWDTLLGVFERAARANYGRAVNTAKGYIDKKPELSIYMSGLDSLPAQAQTQTATASAPAKENIKFRVKGQ